MTSVTSRGPAKGVGHDPCWRLIGIEKLMSIRARIAYTGAAIGVIGLAVIDHFHDDLVARLMIPHDLFHPLVMGALMVLVGLSVLLIWWQFRAEIRRARRHLAESENELAYFREKNRTLLQSVRAAVHEQYAHWGFTAAEVTVGDLLMRGHSTRQIAAMLGKGEGTIRNQTISIYRKAGMTGRNDLAAFFLNEFIGEDDG